MTICDLNSSLFQYKYCPSLGAAVLFTILFALTLAVHVYQARLYRKAFAWVLIMGALWELLGYATRIASIQNPYAPNINHASIVLTVLAPLWINAFDYMVLARMVYFFLPDKKLAGVRAEKISVAFVVSDISSFIIQLIGAVMITRPDIEQVKTGMKILTVGICLQQAVILVFFGMGVVFLGRLKTESQRENRQRGVRLTIVQYLTLLLIALRIIYRIIQFSVGLTSPIYTNIQKHEWYDYVFDALPLLIAVVLFNIYHPGRVLVGPESEFPKLSKQEKKAARLEKRKAKQERFNLKSERKCGRMESVELGLRDEENAK